jgi:diacylglycerol kinase family enzyme
VDRSRKTDVAIPVILNKSSGSEDEKAEERLRAAFEKADARADFQRADSGEDVVRFAKKAAAGKSDVVAVGGGDGTIGAVASVLCGDGKALGLLPLGTFNHFAKDLGIPLGVDEAVRTIVDGRVAQVDLGEVNGRVFVNNSSLGLYPRIVRHREEQRERLGRGKWPAFFWATLHALHRHHQIEVLLSVNGREVRRSTPFVFVGNNFYEMSGFDVGSRERLDAGELSVYMAPGARPRDLMGFALRALVGRLRSSRAFEVLRTAELRIETRGNQVRVSTDGEIQILDTPLRYRSLPGALRVVVPREARKEKAS